LVTVTSSISLSGRIKAFLIISPISIGFLLRFLDNVRGKLVERSPKFVLLGGERRGL
jgi:hypothetical protein